MSEKIIPEVAQMYFELDTRKHQQIVAKLMTSCAKELVNRGNGHDESKLSPNEREVHVMPVWKLATHDIEYGTPEHKEIIMEMGKGWKHHSTHNDHHPVFYLTGKSDIEEDPLSKMNLFALIEMLCDWIAASKRNNNDPELALNVLKSEFQLSEQLENILRITLTEISGGKNGR
jgi:hypothetical protein